MITMNEILNASLEKLNAIEQEIAWTKQQLHDVPFCEFGLKKLLKEHINFLEELEIREMSKTITHLYRKEKEAEGREYKAALEAYEKEDKN